MSTAADVAFRLQRVRKRRIHKTQFVPGNVLRGCFALMVENMMVRSSRRQPRGGVFRLATGDVGQSPKQEDFDLTVCRVASPFDHSARQLRTHLVTQLFRVFSFVFV